MGHNEEYKNKIKQRILQHNIDKQKKRKNQEDRLLLIITSVLFAILLALLLMVTSERDFKSQTCEECLDLCRMQHAHSTYAAKAICTNACFEKYGGVIDCIKVVGPSSYDN